MKKKKGLEDQLRACDNPEIVELQPSASSPPMTNQHGGALFYTRLTVLGTANTAFPRA